MVFITGGRRRRLINAETAGQANFRYVRFIPAASDVELDKLDKQLLSYPSDAAVIMGDGVAVYEKK